MVSTIFSLPKILKNLVPILERSFTCEELHLDNLLNIGIPSSDILCGHEINCPFNWCSFDGTVLSYWLPLKFSLCTSVLHFMYNISNASNVRWMFLLFILIINHWDLKICGVVYISEISNGLLRISCLLSSLGSLVIFNLNNWCIFYLCVVSSNICELHYILLSCVMPSAACPIQFHGSMEYLWIS